MQLKQAECPIHFTELRANLTKFGTKLIERLVVFAETHDYFVEPHGRAALHDSTN